MSVTTDIQAGNETPDAIASRVRAFIPATAMVVLVVVGSLIPLLRNPVFYYWDDTAAVAVGVWQRIPAALLSGELPFLQLDMWRGGNLIAEAATGMWNPVMLGLMFVTHPIDNLAAAITICKIALFVITALGVYRLARGYGADRWMSALAGTMLPLSGWALFIDGSSWINGSAITAFTPWAWWALRRAFRKGFTPWSIVVAVACGYLLTSVGNPYGLLTILVTYIAIAVEAIVTKRAKALWWLIAIGAITLALSVVVYLPFLLTSSVGFRANSEIMNDEFLAVSVSNLLGMSTPSYLPYIRMFGLPEIRTPAMYLAWFLLPILPWLRWRVTRERFLALSSVFVFGGLFLLLVLGPSQFLMFRWPARLTPFLYLAVVVAFAVFASKGFARDRFGLRVTISITAVMVGAWLAASDVPRLVFWHVLSIVGVLALGAVFLRWFRGSTKKAFALLAAGMIVFLGMQMAMVRGNVNVAQYDLPTSRAVLQDGIGQRYQGVTVQIANPMGTFDRRPEGGWSDMLIGTQFAIAGVDATNSYSGIGYNELDSAMCMTYNGSTCPALWTALWERPDGAPAILADLLGAQTVVLQKDFVEEPQTPEGWSIAETTEYATVYVRDDTSTGDGTVTWSDADILSDTRVDTTGEDVEFSAVDGSSVVFGRIAWPGYSATVDGRPLEVGAGPAGLLEVQLPVDVEDGTLELRFTPPGLNIGLAATAVGAAGLMGLLVFMFLMVRKKSNG
ncbi:hypothetical protein ACFC3F_03475 [Microbacterium sp. NPDC055910]|uniref:hypothetical protein n=1 Tax=Microbacterium sp. NPDC055910 TaxID=3345659 RepID=UPI0035E00899